MEYIVTFNGAVRWGPRSWNPFSIENVIEQITGEDVTIGAEPQTGWILDQTHPIAVGIWEIVEKQIPTYDSMFQALVGPDFKISVEDKTAIEHYTITDDTLPHIKNRVKAAAEAKRWEKENNGISISINGVETYFDTDRITRDRLLMQSLYKQDLVWKNDVNRRINLSVTDQQTILTSINTHVQDLFKYMVYSY